MGLPNYDSWKTITPVEVVVDQCGSCDADLVDGQEVYYDGDFMQSFCDKECFKKHVVANIDEFVDVLIDELDVRKKTLEKQMT